MLSGSQLIASWCIHMLGHKVQQAEGYFNKLLAHCTYTSSAASALTVCFSRYQGQKSIDNGNSDCMHQSNQHQPRGLSAWQEQCDPLYRGILKARCNFVALSSNHFNQVYGGFGGLPACRIPQEHSPLPLYGQVRASTNLAEYWRNQMLTFS